VTITCFVYLWVHGLIAIGFQILTAPFLVNKGTFLSNTSDNQIIKTVATSQRDVIAQKSIGRQHTFCSISATDFLQASWLSVGAAVAVFWPVHSFPVDF